jgi:hypothetical protein
VKCARPLPDTRPRARALERHLTALAAQAAGFIDTAPDGSCVGDTLGLDGFADARAWPGGVRCDLDGDREAAEEYADARNYHVWTIERIYQRFLDGEPSAAEVYERHMRALSHLLAAWHALHTPAA